MMRRHKGLILAVTIATLIAPAGGTSATDSVRADQAYDFRLVNQDGRSVQLSEFRGKAVLVSYIFTRCPMPTQDANVIYEDMGEGNFTHNMNTVLVAPDGTVRQRFHGSGWKVHEVIEEIEEVVGQR